MDRRKKVVFGVNSLENKDLNLKKLLTGVFTDTCFFMF